MPKFYIKKKSMHIFIDWLTYAHERALFKYKEDIEILNYNHLSDESRNTIKIEKERLEKSIREYDIFIKELNDLELLVIKHIIKFDNKIKGLDQERYNKIKLDIYIKWCRKFFPSELVYIHELDKNELGIQLKNSRENQQFSLKSVADFLLISESSMKMYETGERTPKINVLFALCELYEIDIKILLEKILKN